MNPNPEPDHSGSPFSEKTADLAKTAEQGIENAASSLKEKAGDLAGLLGGDTLRLITEKENRLKSAAARDARFTSVPDAYAQIQRAISADPGTTLKYLLQP